MGLDDAIRALSARGEAPTAEVVVKMSMSTSEGEPPRALVTQAEAQGRRHTRALLIRMTPDGSVNGHRVVSRDDGAVTGWIGVALVANLASFMGGPAEA